MKFYLETDRLILRDMLPEDRNGLFELDSDPLVHKYLGGNTISKIDDADFVIKLIRAQYESNGIGRWSVIEKETGNFIGWSGLKFITEEENNRVHFYDVGYRLIPKYWGKGYATESCKAALKYGFDNMQLDQIIGTANELNLASKRVLSKCGLVYKSQFMWHDIKCDWMEIDKADWLNML